MHYLCRCVRLLTPVTAHNHLFLPDVAVLDPLLSSCVVLDVIAVVRGPQFLVIFEEILLQRDQYCKMVGNRVYWKTACKEEVYLGQKQNLLT